MFASCMAAISFLQNSWFQSLCASLVIRFCISLSAGADDCPPEVFVPDTRSLNANGSRGAASGTFFGFCGFLERHNIANNRMTVVVCNKQTNKKEKKCGKITHSFI